MNEQGRVLSAPLAAAVATPPETRPCSATWRMQRRGPGRGGRGCRVRPPGRRPLRALSGRAAWPRRRPGCQGLGILLIQRRRAAMSPGQRHCSRRDPALGSLPAAHSTCSLWPRRSRCAMMQSGPTPSLRAGPSAQREAGRRTESREGGGGREGPDVPRRVPQGRARTQPPPTAPGGARDAGGGAAAAGRGEGAGAPPAQPARLGREILQGFLPGGRPSPRQWRGRPGSVPDTRAPALQPAWTQRLPQRKANRNRCAPGSRIFPAWALGVLRQPNAVHPTPIRRAPRRLLSPHFLLPSSSSLPWPGSPHTQQGNFHPRKVFAKDACPCPSFLCPAYHKITTYSEKGEKKKVPIVPAPRKPLSAIISCPRSSLDSSIKESCMKFPKYSINNPLQ